VSNPAPLFLPNDGGVVMLYKGRGKGQLVGAAWAPALEGPWSRGAEPQPFGTGVEDPWLWLDKRTSVLHALFHQGAGSGASWGGAHAFSLNSGRSWNFTGPAYSGKMAWSNGTTTVLARRERPQGVTDANGTLVALLNAAQACLPKEDWGGACRSFSIGMPLPGSA